MFIKKIVLRTLLSSTIIYANNCPKFTILPVGDIASMLPIYDRTMVAPDMDCDGIADTKDSDIDGDNVPNAIDAFPRDKNRFTKDVVWHVSNVTTLRTALENAANNGKSDTIVLDAGTYGTNSDGLGTFTFHDNENFNLTIMSKPGLRRNDVILDGNSVNQVLQYDNSYQGKKIQTLTLKGITIQNGIADAGGGVDSKYTPIRVENCNILHNTATGWSGGNSYYTHRAAGGGIYSYYTITVKNSTISNNTATFGAGGGLATQNGAHITNSTISNNSSKYQGGGIHAYTATVTNSTISNNHTDRYGGGMNSISSVTINNSIVSNNTADYGGGFYEGDGFPSYPTTTTIKNSTISNNTAETSGGGFYGENDISVVNSTISNNSANNGSGGGFNAVSDSAHLIVINSLFINNIAKYGAIFKHYDNYGGTHTYVNNNNFIGNKGSIRGAGIFVNNIFDKNDVDLTLTTNSKIYNNYIDYHKIHILSSDYNIMKKHNLQPASVGDIHLNTNNTTLKSNSPAINKGLNPNSTTYKDMIVQNNQTAYYDKIIKLLATDKIGHKRVHNGTIDIGAVEYGSSK